jgi:hypothetical protein
VPVPDVYEGNTIPDPSEEHERPASIPSADEDPSPGPVHVDTAYADGVGGSADPDGTRHDGAAPGEGEGTGIGESGG